MPRAGTIMQKGGKNVDYYEISMRQISQQILPAGLPPTTVWGYGAVNVGEQERPAAAQRAFAHDRGKVEHAGARQVDQRTEGRATAITCRTCCRSTPRCTGRTRPAA